MSNRIFFILSGIILLIGGIWALFAPFAASLAATIYVGIAFIAAGILHIVQGLRDAEDRFWNIGFGILGVLLGVSFLFNPFGGMLSLTSLFGVLFMGSGLMQLYLAWKRRMADRTLFLVLSGVVSVALALMIAFNLFTASVTLPGIVLGIELITTGFALLTLRPRAPNARNLPDDTTV
ncbi:HdeD family acid-resistance protein [uncultured Sulfitobacter sp.]|uniref:HdeD family acid-resistance protein n=1 Tax=uncultured Sulfitobacter sp. TaxID=191468 RepID=UPI002631826C|nr:HdeD family acid-resistance protein [uncultured Sulfitobacter sp.]